MHCFREGVFPSGKKGGAVDLFQIKMDQVSSRETSSTFPSDIYQQGYTWSSKGLANISHFLRVP